MDEAFVVLTFEISAHVCSGEAVKQLMCLRVSADSSTAKLERRAEGEQGSWKAEEGDRGVRGRERDECFLFKISN